MELHVKSIPLVFFRAGVKFTSEAVRVLRVVAVSTGPDEITEKQAGQIRAEGARKKHQLIVIEKK
jgi:hypothetical protein